MVITELKKDDAVPFIHKYHYSKILPRLTKKYLGVVDQSIYNWHSDIFINKKFSPVIKFLVRC